MDKFLPMRIFDLIYGPSGAAKSEYIKAIIRQMHKETGKKAMVWVGDGSLTSYEGLINKGVVVAGEFGHRPWPQDTLMNRLAMGYTIKDPSDPLSDLVKQTPEQMKEFGLVALEGVSTACKYVMGHVKGGLAWRAAKGENIGPDSAIKIFEGEVDARGNVTGPGTSFGGAGQAHYGQTQSVIVDTINQFKSLPMHVVMSAHEYTNDPEKDDLISERLAGPESAGKKLTGSLQKLFANTIHAMSLGWKENKIDEETKKRISEYDSEWRIYTRDHYATEGGFKLRYKALTRSVDESFPIYFESSTPGVAILDYYRKLKEFKEQAEVDK